MKKEIQQRIRDHELICQLFQLAEKWVELLEQLQSKDNEEKRELLRQIARERTIDRILHP